MRIKTNTKECKIKPQQAMGRVMQRMSVRAKSVEAFESKELKNLVDYTLAHNYSSNALVVDMAKCLECSRCVRACRDLQGLGVWTSNDNAVYPITTTSALNLDQTNCISCGQVCYFLF